MESTAGDFNTPAATVLMKLLGHTVIIGNKTRPVGGKKVIELGILDMSGNVMEWCNDWNGIYSSGSQINPQGTSSGADHVLRGGGWYGYERYCRVSYRNNYTSGCRENGIGFRMTRSYNS